MFYHLCSFGFRPPRSTLPAGASFPAVFFVFIRNKKKKPRLGGAEVRVVHARANQPTAADAGALIF